MLIGHIPPQRSKSPIFEWPKGAKCPEMRRNGLVAGENNVNRIELKLTFTAEVLHAESPSCIWVRLPNHITESALRLSEPYDLEKVWDANSSMLEERRLDLEGQYYMAPYEVEGLARGYARVRILKTEKAKNSEGKVIDVLAKAMFIDYGEKRWLSAECLAKFPPSFPYHPWQAICLSLTNVRKTNFAHSPEAGEPYWSAEECELFRELVGQFKTFHCKVLMGSVVRNDYGEPIRVSMRGMPDPTEVRQRPNQKYQLGSDIAQLFAGHSHGTIENFEVHDSSVVPVIICEEDKSVPERESIPELYLKYPSNWRRVEKVENPLLVPSSEWEEWKVEEAQIQVIDIDWLVKNGYQDQQSTSFWMNVEGAHTHSPYEWYARPIKALNRVFTETELEKMKQLGTTPEEQRQNKDPTLSMLRADEELKERAAVLDAFYSVAGNRNVLEREKVKEAMDNNISVYGITCASDERSAYTGEWQRVEVYKYDEFAHIRYLDSGGRDTIAPCNLYKIHKRHCDYAAMCVQLCLQGVRDPDPAIAEQNAWDSVRSAAFNSLLRVDVPITIDILAQPFKNAKKHKVDGKLFEEHHVLFAKAVSIHGEAGNIDDQMCVLPGKGRAAKDESHPVELFD